MEPGVSERLSWRARLVGTRAVEKELSFVVEAGREIQRQGSRYLPENFSKEIKHGEQFIERIGSE